MFSVPHLPYEYNALSPAISEEIMRLHHDKHHQAYVDKLNAALEQAPEWQQKSIEEILQNIATMPKGIQTTVRNNGGGHYNHSLFWQWLTPEQTTPSAQLKTDLETKYGSYEKFQEVFTAAAVNFFGSGWVWLLADLSITTTPNQDSPIMEGKKAVLGLDVWEHAYYLDYKNVRADYIKKWWMIVNWSAVDELYAS
jgi:Fe-Mn family superoxide dismutase